MANTINPLDGRTVHQIQSGQVIVDLCSVVKELVENSLDAGASSIEIRFRNSGLDSIEVQDNGGGIASSNYQSVALKHHTSKLAEYVDLASLETFGFRGEALSSLCALSKLHIITAQAEQAPKGTRLDFETSGTLKATSITASPKGTTVVVEHLFLSLPVRRKELEKNIKREYGKVLSLLQAYACISTKAKISVSNVLPKGKKIIVFATSNNSSTRGNISNIFGAKALHVLMAMNLQFYLQTENSHSAKIDDKRVYVVGHVSRPALGEGRNIPDRQMFFVNGRPCNLPQMAKVFNDVYKSFNVSQSPFIFANIILDTNGYDVNVSPDKRTIMLHNQSRLLESLRESLNRLFEEQDQTILRSQRSGASLPGFRQHSIKYESPHSDAVRACEERLIDSASRSSSSHSNIEGCQDDVTDDVRKGDDRSIATTSISASRDTGRLLSKKLRANFCREEMNLSNDREISPALRAVQHDWSESDHPCGDTRVRADAEQERSRPVDDIDYSLLAQHLEINEATSLENPDDSINSELERGILNSGLGSAPSRGVLSNAFERVRSRRKSSQVATITIDSKTTSAVLGSSPSESRRVSSDSCTSSPNMVSPQGDLCNEGSSHQMQDIATTKKSVESIYISKNNNLSPLNEEHFIEDSLHGRRQSAERIANMTKSALTNNIAAEGQGERARHEYELNVEYGDEERKAREGAKVAELIKCAEEVDVPAVDKRRRAQQTLKGAGTRDSTLGLVQTLKTSIECVSQVFDALCSVHRISTVCASNMTSPEKPVAIKDIDEQLTLTISKHDFKSMHVIGQFNLGFILATRNGSDLLIIDQHASDEKYNFERLQRETTVQNQRLVQPWKLELTAVDEEVVLNNDGALIKNGFNVEVDQSGSQPVGERCKLLSLPISKEITFGLPDLEELIAVLADTPIADFSDYIPRPSKVRSMFAMRACRSSIMIGRSLTMRQMQILVRHMGEIDKPWNCPHGRPTMRHVYSLDGWIEWKDENGLGGLDEQLGPVNWMGWMEIADDLSTNRPMEILNHRQVSLEQDET